MTNRTPSEYADQAVADAEREHAAAVADLAEAKAAHAATIAALKDEG